MLDTYKAKDYDDELIEKINSVIVSRSAYLDPFFSVDKLADELQTGKHNVSKAINRFYQVNFKTLINTYRIEKVVSMLLSSDYNSFSIEAIGYNAGFRSKAAFYHAFKEQMQVSPTEYIMQQVTKAS